MQKVIRDCANQRLQALPGKRQPKVLHQEAALAPLAATSLTLLSTVTKLGDAVSTPPCPRRPHSQSLLQRVKALGRGHPSVKKCVSDTLLMSPSHDTEAVMPSGGITEKLPRDNTLDTVLSPDSFVVRVEQEDMCVKPTRCVSLDNSDNQIKSAHVHYQNQSHDTADPALNTDTFITSAQDSHLENTLLHPEIPCNHGNQDYVESPGEHPGEMLGARNHWEFPRERSWGSLKLPESSRRQRFRSDSALHRSR